MRELINEYLESILELCMESMFIGMIFIIMKMVFAI